MKLVCVLLMLPAIAAFQPPRFTCGLLIRPRIRASPPIQALSTATALQREARREFLREAAKHHPDRGGSMEDFLAARLEYEQRKQYDALPDIGVLAGAATFLALISTHLNPVTIMIGLLGLAIVLDTPASASASSPAGCLPKGDTPWQAPSLEETFDEAKRWFEETFHISVQ